MKEFMIQLNPAQVSEFIDITNHYTAGIELVSGKTILDGNSILGLYSMNFLEPVTMRVYGTDLQINSLSKALEQFIIS